MSASMRGEPPKVSAFTVTRTVSSETGAANVNGMSAELLPLTVPCTSSGPPSADVLTVADAITIPLNRRVCTTTLLTWIRWVNCTCTQCGCGVSADDQNEPRLSSTTLYGEKLTWKKFSLSIESAVTAASGSPDGPE